MITQLSPQRDMIDVQLVAMGYLISPDGRHYRQIPGLDVIATDTLAAGARVRWGTPPDDAPACAYLWSRVVVLAPSLFEQPGWAIRRVWSHELAHIVTGRCCEDRARSWSEYRYGDLVLPAWVA